jgi:hypothetical protein
MGPKAKGGGAGRGRGGGGGAGRAAPRDDAAEASADALAELEDTEAVLNSTVVARAPATLPDGLWQRRVDKEKLEKEKEKQEKDKAIREKELLQKKMDEMAAELALAKSNVGDVVSVVHAPAAKVDLNVCCSGYNR